MSEVVGGTFTGKAWGAVIDLTIHAPAQKIRLKEETSKVAQVNNASTDAVAVIAERIPAMYSKALYNAGQAIRNHVERRSVKINGQNVVPVSMLESLWVELFGHSDVTSVESVGHTGLVCKYRACKAGLIEACRNGELDRVVSETTGNLSEQIAKVDCSLIESAFDVSIKLDIDCSSEIVRNALAQLSANVREQIEARAKRDAEIAAGQATTEITGHAIRWVQNTLETVIERVTKAEKGTQYKRLIDSVTELVDRLPAYNLTNDPNVSKAIVDIRERLSKVMNVEGLRESDTVRADTVTAAREILADLVGEAKVDAKVESTEAEIDPLANV